MDHTNGYIYIRNHPSYENNNACKLGKTQNIPERDSQYATGEIVRGYFHPVFRISLENVDVVERLLQCEFEEFNIKYNAGTEFYHKSIISMIEPTLTKYKIDNTQLSENEITELVKSNRNTSTLQNDVQSLVEIIQNKLKLSYVPRNYQTIIIQNSVKYFQDNDKGVLVLMCGVGKTLISLWIAQKLNCNTILIGVPNILLLEQWKNMIDVVFPNVNFLMVSNGVNTNTIRTFILNNPKCIILSSYASSCKVYQVSKSLNYSFDIKINDEMHHLTSSDIHVQGKTYINMLKIKSIKQLSLTATMKIIENSRDNNIVSNDNLKYFGSIIDRKCLLWAINNQVICDYVIQTIVTHEEQLEQQLSKFNICKENDKRLFLSAFASIKSIHDGHSHHLLIYSNNKDNSVKLMQYVKMLIDEKYFDIPDLFYSNYHSEMKLKDQKEILDRFETTKFGIISCVYCLGEGWDFPLLDGVVFAENMSSNIRIVQSALRASRKNQKDPLKKTKIILPILNRDDWLENNENPDLKKVREVIYQMGLEDETINQKITVCRIDIKKQTTNKEKKRTINDNEFGDFDDELTTKLKLKTINRTALSISYEKARNIIASKCILCKQDYYELCEKDNRLSKEPEIIFKSQFTNWIDYLSVERIYYDLQTCKNKICEYLLKYPQIKYNCLDLSIICYELCKIDKLFPPNGLWVEYYNVKDLRDIISTTYNKKSTSVIV